jgi:hypothetical protein
VSCNAAWPGIRRRIVWQISASGLLLIGLYLLLSHSGL